MRFRHIIEQVGAYHSCCRSTRGYDAHFDGAALSAGKLLHDVLKKAELVTHGLSRFATGALLYVKKDLVVIAMPFFAEIVVPGLDLCLYTEGLDQRLG